MKIIITEDQHKRLFEIDPVEKFLDLHNRYMEFDGCYMNCQKRISRIMKIPIETISNMVMIIENNDWDNLEDWRYYKQLFRDNGIILDDENQINEEKRNFILEKIKKNNKVECDNCGHTWDLSDGGKDKYMCHKCGHDNEPDKDETAKWIKCRNCNKRFTQTVVKKKKSTPLCPYCKSMN